MTTLTALATLAALAAATPLAFAEGSPPSFTKEEITRILQHGPWPPPSSKDPSNRVSGKAEAIAFGHHLFFTTALSANGLVSCAGCHRPNQAWTDGKPKSVGLQQVDRNAQSVINVRFNRWFGWDGAQDNLWAQTLRPILDSREMGLTPAEFAQCIRDDKKLACAYERSFGAPPATATDEIVLVNGAKAMAAFQESLTSARTPFDDFRDALAKNDKAGIARYPAAAQRGLQLFIGKGQCNVCHFGPLFSNGEFHDVGVPYTLPGGRVDAGRHDGIKKLKASPYTLLGTFNDDAKRTTATKTQHVEGNHANFGQFRTPSLRNVAVTAPYMHNGSILSLRDAVTHYSNLNPERVHTHGEALLLKPLKLSDAETNDLVAFLESLTDPGAKAIPKMPRIEGCSPTGIGAR